jgi:hypothetical protein
MQESTVRTVRKAALITGALVALILAVAAAYLLISDYLMNRMVDREVASLISDAKQTQPKIFTYKMLVGLPEPVRRYFRYALKDGQPYIRYATFNARGDFRMPKTEPWAEFDTREYISTEKPGFIFEATMKKQPYVWIDLRDKYADRAGGMYVNAFSGFNVLNIENERKLNHTCFLRWAGEAVLFPTALLPSEHLRWAPRDENSAKAILTDGSNRSEYVFYFDDLGRITRYESSTRYDIIDGKYQRVGSVAHRGDYKEVNGMMIPTRFSIVRVLPGGKREEFWRGTVSDIKYDTFQRY